MAKESDRTRSRSDGKCGLPPFACRKARWVIGTLLVLELALVARPAAERGLVPKGLQAKGYKVTQYYDAPNELQLKSLLEGGKVVPLGDGKILQFSAGVTLRTFSVTNTPELIVQTSQ